MAKPEDGTDVVYDAIRMVAYRRLDDINWLDLKAAAVLVAGVLVLVASPTALGYGGFALTLLASVQALRPRKYMWVPQPKRLAEDAFYDDAAATRRHLIEAHVIAYERTQPRVERKGLWCTVQMAALVVQTAIAALAVLW